MSGFRDVLGNEEIIEHFKKANVGKKVSHAYILSGEEGSGKKTIAQAICMTLQCQEEKEEPCMECRSCKQILTGNQPDIIYVSHEKPSSIGVEEIRSQLVNDVSVRPYSSPYKIYVIDEAEKLTPAAQNAILKTIEEPPEYGIVLLLTTNTTAFLPTILSRCITLNMKPLQNNVICHHLMEEYQIPDYLAVVVTRFSSGNLGKAIKMASSERYNEMRESVREIITHLENMNSSGLFEKIKEISQYKKEIEEYIDFVRYWFRDVLFFKATENEKEIMFSEEIAIIASQGKKISFYNIENIFKAIEKAGKRLKANVNFEFTLELMFLEIKDNLQ